VSVVGEAVTYIHIWSALINVEGHWPITVNEQERIGASFKLFHCPETWGPAADGRSAPIAGEFRRQRAFESR
jgi:hypothetical protein